MAGRSKIIKSAAESSVYGILLVGGKGVRLRPISTSSRPKAFLPITPENRTMFALTLSRIRKIVQDANIIVVANRRQATHVKKDWPNISRQSLLLEPEGKNTAPAIALAALRLAGRDPQAIMIVLPADHYITCTAKYLTALKAGIDFVKENPASLITLAVRPTYPATGFGYVETGVRAASVGSYAIRKVNRFVEKPSAVLARRYVDGGKHLWNTGTFIFRADEFLRLLKRHAPDIYGPMMDLGKSNIEAIYRRLPKISVDYAVMEKARSLYCIEGDFEWCDLGSLEVLRSVLERELRGFKHKIGARPVSLRILEKIREIS